MDEQYNLTKKLDTNLDNHFVEPTLEELRSLLTSTAISLLAVDVDYYNAMLNKAFTQLATKMEIDGIYYWEVYRDGGKEVYRLRHEWLSSHEAIDSSISATLNTRFIPRIPEWDALLLDGRTCLANDDEEVPYVKETLKNSDVGSYISFPIYSDGSYIGFISFNNHPDSKPVNKAFIPILKDLSDLVVNSYHNNQRSKEATGTIRQQQLMLAISQSLVSKGPLERLIYIALAKLGSYLKVSRIFISKFMDINQAHSPVYCWVKSPKYSWKTLDKENALRLSDMFPHKEPVVQRVGLITSKNSMADSDEHLRLYATKLGIRAIAFAPIYIGGELWGILSLADHEKVREWTVSEELLIRSALMSISSSISRDILEKDLERAIDKALLASRSKSDFLSNMSHEMRTPLNAVIGMTTIGHNATSVERKDEAFAKIEQASKHLLGVINDVLDMSKIESAKFDLFETEFGFDNMIQNVIDFIKFRIDEKHQEIKVFIDTNIPPILVGDEQRIAQVITNLLSNAVKFTPDQGQIGLKANLKKQEGERVTLQIAVSDTGIGINEEQMSRLFRSFEQAEVSTTRKYGGTGLGLAISKHICELMGGGIWVNSKEGEGSTFQFEIILKVGKGSGKGLIADGVNWSNIRVLVVDDDEDIRDFFQLNFSSLGVSCDIMGSAEEAIAALKTGNRYDLFFLDWCLPGKDGIELAREISEIGRENAIVVLFSSTDWSLIEAEAKSAGINMFVQKPLFRSVIVDVINRCLGEDNATSFRNQVSKSSYDWSGHRILLAEDVEINREVIMALLEPLNLQIDFAENGKVCYEMFAAPPTVYDLIFMDIQMPVMDGYDSTILIRKLKHPYAQSVPIIAMTANVFKEDVEHCLAVGMDGHVGKPIDFQEVLAILHKYLKEDKVIDVKR